MPSKVRRLYFRSFHPYIVGARNRGKAFRRGRPDQQQARPVHRIKGSVSRSHGSSDEATHPTRPPARANDPPVVTGLETIWADVFDSDLMITSPKTRRPGGQQLAAVIPIPVIPFWAAEIKGNEPRLSSLCALLVGPVQALGVRRHGGDAQGGAQLLAPVSAAFANRI